MEYNIDALTAVKKQEAGDKKQEKRDSLFFHRKTY
jgi:hypothetical protein